VVSGGPGVSYPSFFCLSRGMERGGACGCAGTAVLLVDAYRNGLRVFRELGSQ